MQEHNKRRNARWLFRPTRANVGTALTTNWIYNNDDDHQYNLLYKAGRGAILGGSGKIIEDKYIDPWVKGR